MLAAGEQEVEPASQPALQEEAETGEAAPRDDAQALPGIALPLLGDPTWYTAAELDTYPEPSRPIRPRYPPEALSAGIEGTVTVLLMVDQNGQLIESSVVEARPAGWFEAAALAVFDSMVFQPGTREGRKVRSRVLVKMHFSPESSTPAAVTAPTGRSP